MATASAGKSFVRSLGEALHHEWRPAGVKVTTLLPVAVDTPIIGALGLDRRALPLPPVSVETAVRGTLRALERGKPVHMPGMLMRALNRTVPAPLVIRMNGRMLRAATARLDNLERVA